MVELQKYFKIMNKPTCIQYITGVDDCYETPIITDKHYFLNAAAQGCISSEFCLSKKSASS